MTRLSRLATFPALGLLLTIPHAFAGAPSYSLSIVAQTGSVIGGYTIGTTSGDFAYATLNDSRQVVFRASGNNGSNWIGYFTPSAVLATSAQTGNPKSRLNFFLNDAGEVYLDAITGVYARPADASAPLSLLFNYSPTLNNAAVFGVDHAGDVGLWEQFPGCSVEYLGTQNGTQVDYRQLLNTAAPPASNTCYGFGYGALSFAPILAINANGKIAYLYPGVPLSQNGPAIYLATTGGMMIGPGSVLGGMAISIVYANGLGINGSGQLAFVAGYGTNQVGIFTTSGLAITTVPGCIALNDCQVSGININDNGLIAYVGNGYIATQYGYVVEAGDTISGKTVRGANNYSNYFLNNHNDLVFDVQFTDGTDAIVMATDTTAAPTATSASSATASFSPGVQTATLAAAVTSSAGTVNGGTVAFTVPGVGGPISAPVTNGSAIAAFPIPAGAHAGLYSIQAAYGGAAGFSGSNDNLAMLSILKATSAVTWPTPAAIAFGSALGSGQLDAAANVAGTFTYTPPAGTVLSVGTNQTLSVSFTPADSTDYSGAAASVLIDVDSSSSSSGGGGGTPQLVLTRSLSRDPATNEIVAIVTIANTGSGAASNVQLTLADLKCTGQTCPILFGQPAPIPAITALPQSDGTIAPAAMAPISVRFPASAGAAGVSTTMSLGGTYTGGSFSSTARVILP